MQNTVSETYASCGHAHTDAVVYVELSDVKAAIAALIFILSNAAKHDCDAETLSNELQQLGLPKGTRRTPPSPPTRITR